MPNRGEPEIEISDLSAQIVGEAMEITSEACNVSLTELAASRRKRAKVSFARQLAMYLCHVVGRCR